MSKNVIRDETVLLDPDMAFKDQLLTLIETHAKYQGCGHLHNLLLHPEEYMVIRNYHDSRY
jgi:hypothetical protein